MHIMSFNCHGFKSCICDITKLCDKYDVVFLQELWLFEDELTILSQVHTDFEGFGISSMDESLSLTILIRKTIRPFANFVVYNDTRLIGLELTSSIANNRYLFLNVYLPIQCEDNVDLFYSILDL